MVGSSRLFPAILAVVLPISPAAAATAPLDDLAVLYDALRAPSVGGATAPDRVLSFGHAEIRPAAGTRWSALLVQDEVCGFVLDGPATFVYRVEDRFSLQVAKRNLKKVRRIDVRESNGVLTLTLPLDGAAVWGWGLDLGALSEPTAPRAVPSWLAQTLEAKLADIPERDMVLSRFDGDAAYRWALLRAGGEAFQLDVDSRPFAREEMLLAFERLPTGSGDLTGRLTSREIVAQPLGRSWLDGNPLDLVAIDTEIDLRAEDAKRVAVATRPRLRVLRDGLRLLSLGLWSETYDERTRVHEYRVGRVLLDGQPAHYLHRRGSLIVRLPAAARSGAEHLLEIEVAGDVLETPAGDNYWRLVSGWYPRPALGGDELAEIRLSIDVPAPWLPFAPGEVLERTSADGRNRVRTRLDGPMERAAVIAGKYATTTVEERGARVHVSNYAVAKRAESERLAQVLFAVRGCLERWLGVPYPFQDLQVVEVNSWGWGQAPPGMIFITQEAFLNRAQARATHEGDIASLATRGINERVAHELAHGWFPHVAKVGRAEENWLSESLADYTAAWCLAEVMDKRQAKYHWGRQLDQWRYWSREAGPDASVFLASHLTGDEDGARAWQFLLYGRGPLVLHAVREQLERQRGKEEADRIFLTWIRSYVRTFQFKYAETRHLVGILDQITGEHWMPFFERHLLGTESPPVK